MGSAGSPRVSPREEDPGLVQWIPCQFLIAARDPPSIKLQGVSNEILIAQVSCFYLDGQDTSLTIYQFLCCSEGWQGLERRTPTARAAETVFCGFHLGVIGQSLAQARGLLSKHAIKQVDRLLSNQAIDPWDIAARWVPEVIESSTDIMVVMDWTDFDNDGQTTLALNKVTPHGRATPLLLLTVTKDDLKNKRNAYEDACLKRLSEGLPKGVKVTILADRGFGDTKLFGYLGTLGFDYVIRFRGNTHVTATTGQRWPLYTFPSDPVGRVLGCPDRAGLPRATHRPLSFEPLGGTRASVGCHGGCLVGSPRLRAPVQGLAGTAAARSRWRVLWKIEVGIGSWASIGHRRRTTCS